MKNVLVSLRSIRGSQLWNFIIIIIIIYFIYLLLLYIFLYINLFMQPVRDSLTSVDLSSLIMTAENRMNVKYIF